MEMVVLKDYIVYMMNTNEAAVYRHYSFYCSIFLLSKTGQKYTCNDGETRKHELHDHTIIVMLFGAALNPKERRLQTYYFSGARSDLMAIFQYELTANTS